MTMFVVKLLKNKTFPLNIPKDVELKHGQLILIQTEKGEEVAKVIQLNNEVAKIWKNKKNIETLNFIKILTPDDIKVWENLKKQENEAFIECKKLIAQHKLNMNLNECRYTFDKKKISFYYTAPERVDFRALLKDLTQKFKRVRIDLRHIGVRDETSILEGNGLCGMPFCCCSWLRNFESINIKLARDQGMPITPSKVSGSCGRLLCCLNYEYANYLQAAKDLPPVGSGVMTADGIGRVCALHFLSNKLAVKLEDGKIKEFTKSEIEILDGEVNISIDDSYPFLDSGSDFTLSDLKCLEDDKNSSTGNV